MKKIQKLVAIAFTCSLLSCAVNPYTGEEEVSNSGWGAGGGAVLGAIIGGVAGKGAAIGAATGAAF